MKKTISMILVIAMILSLVSLDTNNAYALVNSRGITVSTTNSKKLDNLGYVITSKETESSINTSLGMTSLSTTSYISSASIINTWYFNDTDSTVSTDSTLTTYTQSNIEDYEATKPTSISNPAAPTKTIASSSEDDMTDPEEGYFYHTTGTTENRESITRIQTTELFKEALENGDLSQQEDAFLDHFAITEFPF
jgi:hypothetical protein